MEGRCNACGSTSPLKKDCSKAATASCSVCNRRGHFSTVCMADFYAWRDKNLRREGAKINKVAGQNEYSDYSEFDDAGARSSQARLTRYQQ